MALSVRLEWVDDWGRVVREFIMKMLRGYINVGDSSWSSGTDTLPSRRGSTSDQCKIEVVDTG